VNEATEGRQTPWESSSLTEDFRFVVGTTPMPPTAANAGPRPPVTKRTMEEWQRDLQGKPIALANEMVVADGTVDAYAAFVTLYTDPPFGPQAREWLELHRKMAAWNEAVLLNTAASYRAFLVQYPDSDLTLTARRLIERLRNRPSPLPVVAAAASVPVQPTNVALGPTCPCTAPVPPVQPIKKADVPVKKTESDTPKRKRPPRRDDGDDDVVVYRQPPPEVYLPAPPPPVGIGIGIGIGGGRWGGGGIDRGPPGRRGNY
jgi:hypothetical protein